MKCPHCDTLLQMTDRQGIEIDYCPSCRGVWLDRGELDKLIERSTQADDRRPESRRSEPRSDYQHQNHHRQGSHYKKRKSFLGELFDVFD
ncbi:MULTISPECIES: TFIIB-type zinc ribbon-containing protein [Marinomonas]|uniref:Predicted nucleic acid-binding protein, contains Zn-finger domain n=1 Tax=Marinomonas fungiae TaxID=1137284 RepID=A0A0K6IUD9_9GAMM|nr:MULTISPECIES: zf-TFIIB domain-containing protein [Marinomonas]CUB06720.1 Predicted nucleic acid-binding protein, contains Zn-finger domain [Marinomonas fungiae]